VPLDPEDASVTTVGRLRYRGGLSLSASDDRFGGLSALHVSEDGTGLIALSDKGHWLRARLLYGPDGGPAGLEDAEMGELPGLGGKKLRRRERDAESLAVLPDGSIVVAFERIHRLWRYPAGETAFAASPLLVKPLPGLTQAPANDGIEALTVLADGRLLAITEEMWRGAGRTRGWVGGEGGWRPLSYPLVGDFRPTGAATLPSGDVVVLERSFSPLRGPATRLRLLPGDAIAPGRRLTGTELGRLAPPLTVDNFEGIAIRQRADGTIWIYLLSDDNFNFLQRTLLLVFELLPEP